MTRFVLTRAMRRALVSIAGVAVLFTAVMGYAHTPSGRPLLKWMGMSMPQAASAAGCPLGYDVKQSPEQKEAARQRFAAAYRGESAALARPALGFDLEQTTREALLEWAQAHGVKCTVPRSQGDLDCADVPASLFPGLKREADIRNLWVTFGADGRLVSLIAVSRAVEAAPISATFRAANATLATLAGPALKRDGEGSVEELKQGLLRQASAEYRFQDFYALTRVTNMGDGFVLTEEYRALPKVAARELPSR
ncbi:hypothetical protein D7W79_27875 [Corallococcus exercitus]|uniref:hypothetical protein n=1 Tax=Corallococcus exercitus TaxID=2316736 RepID=UPI000EA01C25|nr:hypothetical protein [Corallococcus exercitus]RKG72605.1 hypothetical protein D7W79_27875 [Corallococcus exercitus]